MKKRTPNQAKEEVQCDLNVSPKYENIKLGIDWHATQYLVVRIIDGSGPEPAQRFKHEKFMEWAAKQLKLAKKVFSCYETGASGYVLHRQLEAAGIINVVVVARKLDADHRKVQNDALDARELALNLDRYVAGNPRAIRLVHVPTPEQEQKRHESRLRKQLSGDRMRLATRGRMLLLNQGWRESNLWWKPMAWEKLQIELPEWIIQSLEVHRKVILALEAQISVLRQKLQKAAPAERPKGMGALTCEELDREVCDWKRFKNRKSPGSYAGLCGGLSASGDYSAELSITKSGSARLRTMLVELAWRWVAYQSQTKLVQRWARILLNPEAHARARKRAIVAVARQLFVDLWRWRTGRCSAQDLGWVMLPETVKQPLGESYDTAILA